MLYEVITISLLGGEEIYVPGLYNEPPAQLVSPLADNNSYYNEPVPVVWNNMPDVAPEPSPPVITSYSIHYTKLYDWLTLTKKILQLLQQLILVV